MYLLGLLAVAMRCRGRRTETDLEEHLDTHRQDTVYDSEGKDERHRIDVQAQEPAAKISLVSLNEHSLVQDHFRSLKNTSDGVVYVRKRCHRQLHIHRAKVILDHGQTPLDERFEYPLIEQRAFHRWTANKLCSNRSRRQVLTCSIRAGSDRTVPPTARTPALPTCSYSRQLSSPACKSRARVIELTSTDQLRPLTSARSTIDRSRAHTLITHMNYVRCSMPDSTPTLDS